MQHLKQMAVVLRRVRETLDFAARVQGVGHKEEELRLLLEREEAAGLEPDQEIDAFVKVAPAGVRLGFCQRTQCESAVLACQTSSRSVA